MLFGIGAVVVGRTVGTFDEKVVGRADVTGQPNPEPQLKCVAISDGAKTRSYKAILLTDPLKVVDPAPCEFQPVLITLLPGLLPGGPKEVAISDAST